MFNLSMINSGDSSSLGSCSPYHFIGIFNQDSSSVAEFWFYRNKIYIHLEDSVRCLRLSPTSSDVLLPDIHLFEELPCVSVDPEPDPGGNQIDPVNCDMNIEVVIFSNQDFLEKVGGKAKAENYAHDLLNGPDGVASIYRRYIREYGGTGTISFNYVLDQPNGTPNIIVFPVNYDPIRDTEKLEEEYKKLYPCLPKDMFIYLHDAFTNVTTRTDLLHCHTQGLNSPITINLAYNRITNRAIETAAHEFGHYFSASHLSTDPLHPCYCEPNMRYLMCSPSQGLNMDICSWQKIAKIMNDNCECLSDMHAPPCENCLGLYSKLELSNNKLSDVICNNGSESMVTITIHNDCTPRNFTYVKIAFSKGALPTHDKLEIVDPIDFTGGIDDSSDPSRNFLIYNVPFTLGKNEKKILKCKVRLLRKGTSSNPEQTVFNIHHDHGININGLPTFSPTGVLGVGQLYLTDQPGVNTIANVISSERQYNLANCNQLQKNLKITRDLIINQDHIFSACVVYLAESKKIIVNENIKLTICKSVVNSCDNFWNTIELKPGAQLIIEDSEVNHAEHVTTSLGTNIIDINGSSIIQNCQNGITCASGSSGSNIKIMDSEFNGMSGYIAKIENAELFESKNSTFQSCFGGIGLNNSPSKFTSSKFIGMGNGYRGAPETTSPWKGTAVYSMGAPSTMLETIKDPDPHVSDNLFSDLNCAIFNSGSTYNLQGNIVENGEYGIYISNSGATAGGLISQNEIEVGFLGINLDQNGNMPCTISKNEVACTSTYGTAIQVAGNSGTVLIEDNTVTNETGQAGILANTCANVNIKNNNVYTNATNGTRTDGIYVLNSMNCTISCNNVSCAAFGNGTSAVEIQESPFNTVSCNEIEGADCGLVYAGSCNPNDVSENFLGNHKLGLVLVTRATGGDGIIGPQSHKGNHITGCGTDKDAVNYGPPNVVTQSPFLVSPSAPYLPNNIQELVLQNWFLPPVSGIEFSCQTANICPTGIGARSSSNKSKIEPNHHLLENNIGLAYYDNERTWSARKNILEFIKSDIEGDWKNKQWINRYHGTSLDLFSDVGLFCNHFFTNYITTQTNSSEITKVNEQNQDQMDSYLTTLENLQTETKFEKYQKIVSTIRLKYLSDTRPIIPSDENILNAIANKCPYEYGNAVYEARMLLASTRPVVVNESDLCGTQALSQKQVDVRTLLTYPNPASQQVDIQLTGFPFTAVFSAKLLDINGKQLMHYLLKKQDAIDVSNLVNGIYFLMIDQHPELTTKICVHK